MKSTIILALMATAAIAQPHHHHHAKHNKRAETVEWVIEMEYVTETVDVTTTIWVSSGFVPPPTTESPAPASVTPVPAQFYQGASSAPQVSPPSAPAPPSPEYVAPAAVAPTPALVPEPAPYVAPYVAPVESSSSTSSTPQPSPQAAYTPPPPPEPVYTPPTTPAAAAPSIASAPETGSGSGSTGGKCSEGSPCKGDITHYDANAGIGACGWTSDGDSEAVVALPHGLMGTQSNGNPYCGKEVKVSYGGKTVSAKVVDKCMGCEAESIDLSNKIFSELLDMGVGRTQAEWWFTS